MKQKLIWHDDAKRYSLEPMTQEDTRNLTIIRNTFSELRKAVIADKYDETYINELTSIINNTANAIGIKFNTEQYLLF